MFMPELWWEAGPGGRCTGSPAAPGRAHAGAALSMACPDPPHALSHHRRHQGRRDQHGLLGTGQRHRAEDLLQRGGIDRQELQ